MKLFLPSDQFPVKGNCILQTTLTCYDVVVCKMLVEFFNERLSDACNILVERIPQGIDHFGDGEVESGFVCMGT